MGFLKQLLIIAVLAVIASCGSSQQDNRARMLADQYYRAIQADRLAEAAELYPGEERALALEMLQQTRERLGELKSFHFTGSEQNTVFSGRFYIFSVATEYAQGEHSERLTLRAPVNTNEVMVVSQKIDPSD